LVGTTWLRVVSWTDTIELFYPPHTETAMNEIERRVVAHELALIEVAAHVERSHMLEAIKSIRAGFVIGITEEERSIRIAAIDILEEAMRRHEPGVMGMSLQGRPLC
jgi:hypothetical protein